MIGRKHCWVSVSSTGGMIIAPTQAIDPSDLWRQREVGRSTDIVVDGERGREDFVGNGSSFTEVRPGTRLQQPLRMRAKLSSRR
jgi:hypothetical protein